MPDLIADTKFAIGLEEKGYAFYQETAGKTNNPLAISTLNSLAERELLHIERIKAFYQNITDKKPLQKDWLEKATVPPSRAALLKPILEKLKIGLNQRFETTKEINNAYAIAEGLERDSFSLYERIASEASDETTKKFFSALAKEEHEHFAILDETLEYLENPGEWYRLKERWIVEG